jgi:UDP-N-acetylmuramoyl-tripeptide--D-alanyl-D-alanine ligase
MEPRTLDYIAQACGGSLLKGRSHSEVSRLCTDSRNIQAGCLFFALVGERFDAHDFLIDAVEKGAMALVVQRVVSDELLQKAPAVVLVDDTTKALGRLACRYRRDFQASLIAVGGSNGKTTTKEIIGAVLEQSAPTLRNEASFNNQIGVPLTLLRFENTHKAAVIEIGSNHPGELEPLIDMISPDIGVITSIGREHLEFFKNLDGVANEEGCLAEQLADQGVLIVNGDSPRMHLIVSRAKARVMTIGFGEDNDWRVMRHVVSSNGCEFSVKAPDSRYSGDYCIGLLGRHQITNALLAIAVGAEHQMPIGQIRKGLAACVPPKARMNRRKIGGIEIIDDGYNANADSMMAALDTLRILPCAGRRIAVLGEMAELGDASEAAHAEVGFCAGRNKVDALFAIGQWAEVVGENARKSGVSEVYCLADLTSAISRIKAYLKDGDVILLKASRAMQMERLSQELDYDAAKS